jgi:fumarate reductase flavoprotein subunit
LSSSTSDLIVVGGGIAGWTAALSARLAGASVVLLELHESDVSGGNTVLSAGVFHAAYLEPERKPGELRDALLDKVDGHARSDVVDAWANNVRRARDFLAAHGGRFFRFRPEEQHWNVLEPMRAVEDPTTRDLLGNAPWRDMGPHRLLQYMHDEFVARGGRFIGGARARRISTRARRITGVEVERAGGAREMIAGSAVVLADGGFQGNRELVAQYITSTYCLRGSPSARGDGLLMAQELGAATSNMNAFYGHVLVRDSLHNNRLWPDPSPEAIIDRAIVVDGSGRRLIDEWRPDAARAAFADRLAGPIAWSETPGACWVIFDRRIWDEHGTLGLTAPANPTLVDEAATVLRASSTTELARQAGLPAGALATTVDAFNRFCRDGTPMTPARSGDPRPIEPPYYAIPLVAGITFAMGGVLVDGRARVLDGGGEPIPGLYAAGGTMSGLQGGPRNGYAGGWSEAATFGLLAGESAAAFRDGDAAARAI